ncbi:hypothetical protein ABZ865_29410 [Streptomyces sp. NPDC047085]|uniref:hypothetical protein n=1 Tax=Streptomyces sp. NPDC047085 TaxID=3155140 RepID=UPI0033C9E430
MPITHHRVPITVKVDRAALHGVVCRRQPRRGGVTFPRPGVVDGTRADANRLRGSPRGHSPMTPQRSGSRRGSGGSAAL